MYRNLFRTGQPSLAPRHTPQNLKWKWTRDLRPELRYANTNVSIAPSAQYPRLKKAGLPHPAHAMFPSRYPVTLTVKHEADPRRDFMRLNKHIAGLGMPRHWRFSLFHLALGSRNNIEVQRWLGRVWWLRLERLAKYFLFMSKVEIARGIRKEHLLRGKVRHAMAIPRTKAAADMALPSEYRASGEAERQAREVASEFTTFAPLVDLDTTTSLTFQEGADAEVGGGDETAQSGVDGDGADVPWSGGAYDGGWGDGPAESSHLDTLQNADVFENPKE